jgi:hypothetical protein
MVRALPMTDPTAFGSASASLDEKPSSPRVCVIGAGMSGLVSAKALLDRSIPFECFEISNRVGGLWVFKNENGRSAAYRSLHINTSRDRMQLGDFPMPRDFPDYPHHEAIAAYLESYAEHFELSRHIRFRTRVDQVRPKDTGYEVTLDDGSRQVFDAVIVANGHHWAPHFPESRASGAFAGLELHAHEYVDPSEPHQLRGRRVVVVGFGNSAVDIACELAKLDAPTQVMLSVRRGAWVLPKYVFGRPLDQTRALPSFLPRRLNQALASFWYRRSLGAPTRFGLPEPDHRLGDAHPTVSSELLPLIAARKITPKPALHSRDGHSVRFVDGTSALADAIVYATGYEVRFPFFDPSYVTAPNNELLLYLRVFHPLERGLYFVGLCQPLGPLLPIAEAQAKLVAAHLCGAYQTPSPEQMLKEAQSERERVRRRFGPSPRHTMQVDFDAYLETLRKLLRESANRASSASETGPI